MNVPSKTRNRPVFVVSDSRINLIVVSEIVQMCGLAANTHALDGAYEQIISLRPDLAILDGGASNRDCDSLLERLTTAFGFDGESRPRIIMLTNRNGTTESLDLPAIVDKVVPKPIIIDRLQPAITYLTARN